MISWRLRGISRRRCLSEADPLEAQIETDSDHNDRSSRKDGAFPGISHFHVLMHGVHVGGGQQDYKGETSLALDGSLMTDHGLSVRGALPCSHWRGPRLSHRITNAA